ncbi:MAG TPA: MFS transporter [Bacteroidia bacterium]|nr:MFS transporter [Bacteroidia bacterium]
MTKAEEIKNNPKVIRAWSMYDWANSVYSLVITSTIFPIYYSAVTSNEESDIVYFLGREFKNTALYSYVLSFSFLIIALVSPILSGIADYSGAKKSFMKFFCWLGGLSCVSLYFFTADTLWIGILGFVLATIGFSGSLVFYNAFLPEIATPDRQDRVSARGFALGYIGSSLLLIFNLIMIQQPAWFGISESSFAPRFSFLLVGVWRIGFASYSFYHLPSNVYNRKVKGSVLLNGYKELLKVVQEIKHQKALLIFLVSFFFYNMGVQTVMYVAALFGDKELELESGQLILTILIIQFVAIGGAYLFSYLSSKFGNVKALLLALIVWTIVCFAAYFIYHANEFYMLAFTVGMVMGGVQSLSRSTYSKLLPNTMDHSSYFSFYDVCDKFGTVLGTASYGLIEELTGSMRNSVVTLMSFFIAGLILLVVLLRNLKKQNNLRLQPQT